MRVDYTLVSAPSGGPIGPGKPQSPPYLTELGKEGTI